MDSGICRHGCKIYPATLGTSSARCSSCNNHSSSTSINKFSVAAGLVKNRIAAIPTQYFTTALLFSPNNSFIVLPNYHNVSRILAAELIETNFTSVRTAQDNLSCRHMRTKFTAAISETLSRSCVKINMNATNGIPRPIKHNARNTSYIRVC